MIFNAFSIIALGGIATATAATGHNPILVWVLVVWIVGMTLWVNWLSIHNPRALGYSGRELLEHSRLEYEHNLAIEKLRLEHRGK
jgi:hypothetical protein